MYYPEFETTENKFRLKILPFTHAHPLRNTKFTRYSVFPVIVM